MEYYEGGAIVVVLGMVGGMWVFLQKLITTRIQGLHDIIVKLIDRFNKIDETADRRHELVINEIDQLKEQVSLLREKISFLQGRINGKTRL